MNLDFSIIILFYNKNYEINLVLKALTMQAYDLNRFEVIIIDDGSDEPIDDVVREYSSKLTIVYQKISHSGNRGRNRNNGVQAARAERIIFLDSDVIPGLMLLKEFDEATRHDKNVISLGRRQDLLPFDHLYLDEKMLERDFGILDCLPSENDIRTIVFSNEKKTGKKWNGDWQILYSHCFCLWKSVFQKSGGFDENFINWGAEDIELGYRLFKAGARIEVNHKTISYHLHHPVNFNKTIRSLKLNYDLFLEKHVDWEVELFTREIELWAVQAIRIQEAIKSRKHIISKIENLEEFKAGLPDNTLLAGVEVPELLQCKKVNRAFIPESASTDPKILNIMGIHEKSHNQRFELAVLSEKYGEINPALLEYIRLNLLKVAKDVIVIGEKKRGQTGPADMAAGNPKPKRFITFALENDTNANLSRFWFLNLALAMDRAGVVTSVELAYDPHKELHANTGYLFCADPVKDEAIKRMCKTENNFMGDQIPCFMELETALFSNRSIGKRVYWDEIAMDNLEKYHSKRYLNSYDTLFCRQPSDVPLFAKDKLPIFFPAGVDADEIRKMKNAPQPKNDRFVFLWIEQFTSLESNLEQLLAVFDSAFRGKDSAVLRVIVPDNKRLHYGNEYYNPTHDRMLKNSIAHFNLSHQSHLEALKERFRGNADIQFITGKTSLEACREEVRGCDCFMDIGGLKRIHPMALESVAFGKKAIVLDDGRLDGYGCEKALHRVKSKKVSALKNFGAIESPNPANADQRRYFLISEADEQALSNALTESLKSEPAEASIAERLLEVYDWNVLAKSLISSLY